MIIHFLCSSILILFEQIFRWFRFFYFVALEDQRQMTKELENTRRQIDEAQLRSQQEREEQQRENERMMERMNYEQEEKNKIVC